MSLTIILSYALIIGGIVIWSLLLPKGRQVPKNVMDGITVFGGAFLLGSCFINLVPHMYADGFAVDVYGVSLKVGIAVLVGFLIQLVLEYMTHGVEHGHNHCHANHVHPMTGLLIGLCIHAFLEGMPLVDSDGELHQSLLYGIVLHNIPIALVLVSICLSNRYTFAKTLFLLTIFAVMTPLGSLCNTYCMSSDATVQALIMGIVVGILLHVSVSILFDHGNNTIKWWKIMLIILAFIAAYLTPGCPEIYG